MLEIPSLAAGGWLLMYNPTENLWLPITEWEQSLAFDTAAECETFIAMRWVKAEKENREFKLERYRCVPADVVYPHNDAQKIKTALRWICRNAIESQILHLPTPS